MAHPTPLETTDRVAHRAGGVRRSRMLGTAALLGAAALVTGCGIQQSAPGSPTGPTSPPVAIVGADPVPLDDALLQVRGLADEVQDAGYAVRWLEPGRSIAVFVAGSGSGGDCIAQPHAAGVEPNAPSIVVRFDAPDPEAICTMDLRLHGWELGLAEPIDAERVVPVRLVNLQGTDDVIELELGPDDVLVSPTADPQPSEIPDAGGTPEPERIPDAVLDAHAALAGDGVSVHWVEPGRSIAVLFSAPGSPSCTPRPVGATSSAPGMLEIDFEPAAQQSCGADVALHGWHITLQQAVTATLPVSVTVSGATGAGSSVETTLSPDDVLELR